MSPERVGAMTNCNGSEPVDDRRFGGFVRRVGVGLAVACLLAALSAVGCGPIKSTQRIGQASVALERARVVEAYRKAPYEFFSARYYLHKAREEWGYSEFEASFDYADEAREAAEAALRKTEENPWKDPVEGRKKSYKLRPQETITVDPENVEEAEGVSKDGEGDGAASGSPSSSNSGS